MRHFTKLALGLALSSVMTFSASAEIIDSDWLTEGDGLTFTDTDTGLEFLDLTETLGMSISGVESLLDTTYAGWAFATADQTVSMLTNLLADTEVQYGATDGYTLTYSVISSRDEIFDVVGGYGSNFVYGFISDSDISMYGFSLSSSTTTSYSNYVVSSYGTTFSHAYYGTWLVRDSSVASSLTDAPAPLALSSLALLGFGLTRRKHTKKDF